MFAALLSVLGAALSIWSDKEKHKYIDQLIKLKEEYYAEYNKPEASRSDATLDNLEFQLRLLGHAFAASVGEQNTPNQS